MKSRHNHYLSVFLVVVLAMAASLPQGYMVTRGADNIVEIVVCRGFGEHSRIMFLDLDSGAYVDQGTVESPDGEKPPCHFSSASFEELSLLGQNDRLPQFGQQTKVIARSWQIIASFYRTANPRAPPVQLV